jgi:hypothetical protein
VALVEPVPGELVDQRKAEDDQTGQGSLLGNALENYRTLGDRIIEVPKGMLALSLVFEIRRICLGRARCVF